MTTEVTPPILPGSVVVLRSSDPALAMESHRQIVERLRLTAGHGLFTVVILGTGESLELLDPDLAEALGRRLTEYALLARAMNKPEG